MRNSVNYAAIILFGTLMVCNAAARCNEVVVSSRDTIIQGVRDDVRRKIQERNVSSSVHARSNPKQDAPR